MSTVGAFAAYGPLGGFGFPTQGPKNRVSTSDAGETRPGAGPQRADGSQRTAGGVPEPSRESTAESNRPVIAAEASERDRLETAFAGANPEEKAIATAGLAAEVEKEIYDPSASAEELDARIEAQVQRFEEFLERLNQYAKLRDSKRDEVEEVTRDLYGRAELDAAGTSGNAPRTDLSNLSADLSELGPLPELDVIL